MSQDGNAGEGRQGGDSTVPKKEAPIISLVVKDQTGTEVMFKVKPHTRLAKVMDAYCTKKGLDKNSVRFLFEGNRISDDETPEQLDMEDGDHIDCVITQIGGSH